MEKCGEVISSFLQIRYITGDSGSYRRRIMTAEIISIGNELLNGNTVNSNATFMSRRLHEMGILVERIQTLRDDASAISEALDLAMNRARIAARPVLRNAARREGIAVSVRPTAS